MISILGNEALLKLLFRSVRDGKMAGCYLLEGTEGSGKLTIARTVAAALTCPNQKQDGTPCMVCPSCKNALSGNHIDIFELRPEEDKKSIPVDAVREAIRNMYILPSQSEARVFIIESCECLKKEAQNALLKSIEEPRPNTVFFLLTTDLSRLLPTVRSRAVKLSTEPLSNEILRKRLEEAKLSPEQTEEALLLCGGSLGKALQIANDPVYAATRKRVLDYFSAILHGAGFTKLCLIIPPEKTTRNDLSLLFPMIKMALRDLICFHFSDHCKAEFFSQSKLLEDLASVISPEKAVQLYSLTQKLESGLEHNANLFASLSQFHLSAGRITLPS